MVGAPGGVVSAGVGVGVGREGAADGALEAMADGRLEGVDAAKVGVAAGALEGVADGGPKGVGAADGADVGSVAARGALRA
jgi:hypothetical protein